MTAVLSAPRSGSEPGLHFGCHSCGATLSVPRQLAGVSGACPLCGEWLESPVSPAAPVEEPPAVKKPGAGGFAAARTIVAAPRPEAGVQGASRMQYERDWRAVRARRARMKQWFQRRQAVLSVSALIIVASAVGFFASLVWKLPWQLPEDSLLVRLIDNLTGDSDGGESGGDVPSSPRRR